jgi:hypothetical protein
MHKVSTTPLVATGTVSEKWTWTPHQMARRAVAASLAAWRLSLARSYCSYERPLP